MARITKRAVDALGPGETIWDSDLPGFGVRCQRRDKIYLIKARIDRRQRWLTIGKHGLPWTPELARKEALRLLGSIASGEVPGKRRDGDETRLRVVAQRFLDEHVHVRRKPATIASYEDLLRRFIVPALGDAVVHQLTPARVSAFHNQLRSTPYQANRALAVLSKLISFADQQGLMKGLPNPCRRVEKFKEHARQRYLSAEEIARLLTAINHCEQERSINTFVAAAIRLLLLTGGRLSEITTLRWAYVDLDAGILILPDSKTGPKRVFLNEEAARVLRAIPKVVGNPYVIVGERAEQHLVNLQKPWRRVRVRAELPEVRLHDLRHTFASIAAGAGGSLPAIGGLLGHSQPATTQRYAHLADDGLRKLGQRVGDIIGASLNRPHGRPHEL